MGKPIHRSNGFKGKWTPCLVAMGLLLGCFFQHVAYGQEDKVSAKTVVDILRHPAVDRVIPSQPRDLFVVLKNGLTVLIRETRGSKVVSCQVLVKTGSIDEGQRMGGGLSHYLEHVVSGGTTSKFTESDIKKKVQSIGGATNAYTSYDHTVYFINTTGGHCKTALELLLSYVTDCQFEEKAYQREKKVILQEFQMGENNPSRQLWRLFSATAYREHPVRLPVIGQRDVFARMDKDDLVAHYRRWYTPENMVVAVAGDVDKKQVLGFVLESVADLRRTAHPPYVLAPEPPQLSPRRVEKNVAMARLTSAILGFRTVALADPDLYGLDVLAVILGEGRTSALYRKVRDEKRLVLSISSGSWTPQFVAGQFTVSMTLAYSNISKALNAVWEVLDDVKTHAVDNEVLQRAKNKVVADHVFSSESAETQASQLASDWAATGDPYFSDHYVERIQKVTREDVKKVANKYFDKDKMTLAVVRPSGISSDRATAVEPNLADSGIVKRVLANHMTLLLKKMSTVPIVSFEFVAEAGLRFEPPEKPGICHFMMDLLTKGTTHRSKLEIAKALEDVGGSIGTSSGRNSVGVSVSVLKKHFNRGLDILADVILNPSFPVSEIQKQREDTILAIRRLDESWATEISRLFKRHYYRKHPYRNDVLGKPETVEAFNQKDMKGFYKKIIKSNNAVLAVFGDIDPDTVITKVKKAFHDFKPGILEQPIIERETENIQDDETFVVTNEKTSAAMVVGYNGLALNDKEVPAVDVLDAIISGIGYPSGWLYDALRGGDKSLVYYVHAYPAFGIDGGYFAVMTQTTPDNYDEVLATIEEKMSLIQQEAVNPETLKKAKNVCTIMHQLALEKGADQAFSSALNESIGLGYDYDSRYPGLVERVTGADVLRVAKRLFGHHLVVATMPAGKEKLSPR